MTYSSKRYSLLTDHLGSLVATANNGILVTQEYEDFGRIQPLWQSTLNTENTEIGYTGQRLDETGLLYYNARYYDPVLGQFLSPDPLIPDPTKVFAFNRYMYSFGNPIKYNDPSGHCPAPPEENGGCHLYGTLH